MRIGLIYLGRHGPGGPISFELASHLSRDVDLFAVVSQNADHINYWRNSGLPIIEVPTFQTRLGALISFMRTSRLRRLASQISALRPDVLLCPMVHPWTPALQKHLPHIPVVTTVHDPAAHPGLTHWMSSLWEKRSARMASRCVLLSETFVDQMQAHGISREKIDIIPHAIFSFYEKFAKNVPRSGRVRSILFFGRITRYKGIDTLLRAFQISQAATPGLQLQIVGEGDLGPYRDLIGQTKDVSVVNRWVDDAEVPDIFQAADIVVIPYSSASQSGVIALAATFARPVIATRVGALPEQIRDGETGVLVEPTPEALASGIDRLITDDEFRERIGQKLASDMRSKSDWSTTSKAYLQSCRKALENQK
jgi:glycosyltransferase involved in cell wall biosynthesis